MDFKVLCVGDVFGEPGMERIRHSLSILIQKTTADFIIVNGENASLFGITPAQADDIFAAGANVITLGNHAFSRWEICDYLNQHDYILRPVNYAPSSPGKGWGVYDTEIGPVAVINMIGQVKMDSGTDNPFLAVNTILSQIDAKIILAEMHAEMTSEKLGMGFHLDGRVSAVWGTHTHVPTADTMVLPKGTGYVTDLGMTGPIFSVIGTKPDFSVARFCGELPSDYSWADGPTKLNAVLFTIDSETGRCHKVQRVDLMDSDVSQQ